LVTEKTRIAIKGNSAFGNVAGQRKGQGRVAVVCRKRKEKGGPESIGEKGKIDAKKGVSEFSERKRKPAKENRDEKKGKGIRLGERVATYPFLLEGHFEISRWGERPTQLTNAFKTRGREGLASGKGRKTTTVR